jgi:SAM-dependent methyltransferase
MKEYDQIHDWYLRTRLADVGVPEIEAIIAQLPPNGSVIDLGCGTGLPLAKLMSERGLKVFGVDSSRAMIGTFRQNLSAARAECCRMEDVEFPAGSFHAAIAWGSLFHLSIASQEAVIAKVGAWLKPDGIFLFTAAEEAGTASGPMNGVEFGYVSLERNRYKEVLEQAGMKLQRDFRDAYDNYVYIAKKSMR